MKIIGITGGIGSGKTAVLDIMQRDYGAFIMEADALAHRLMEPGQISYNDIVEHFGRDILDEDSRIDRAKLSAVVFSGRFQRSEAARYPQFHNPPKCKKGHS